MFTGIIAQIGIVESITRTSDGIRLMIDPQGWSHRPQPGDSIANNGCCLTLVDPIEDHDGVLSFDVIPQTLDITTLASWVEGDRVNLERALAMGDTLDGHQVQGHVDGIGKVIKAGIQEDQGYRIRIELESDQMKFMIPKGSISIDGTSLTIAQMDVDESWVEVALIPETLERTNLRDRKVGDRVNIECDMMVKTIIHTMKHYQDSLG